MHRAIKKPVVSQEKIGEGGLQKGCNQEKGRSFHSLFSSMLESTRKRRPVDILEEGPPPIWAVNANAPLARDEKARFQEQETNKISLKTFNLEKIFSYKYC